MNHNPEFEQHYTRRQTLANERWKKYNLKQVSKIIEVKIFLNI